MQLCRLIGISSQPMIIVPKHKKTHAIRQSYGGLSLFADQKIDTHFVCVTGTQKTAVVCKEKILVDRSKEMVVIKPLLVSKKGDLKKIGNYHRPYTKS